LAKALQCKLSSRNGYKLSALQTPPPAQNHHEIKSWVKVAAVVISGLAVNWVSDLFAPSVSVILLVALISLILLVLADSPRSHFNPKFLRTLVYRDSLKFGLASLLLGAAVGAAWLLPLFPKAHIDPEPLYALMDALIGRGGVARLYNYEIGAVLTIVTLGVAATVRKARLVDVLIFGISSVAGMSMILVSLAPPNLFLATFIGWSITYILLALLIAIFPDIVRLFANFWRLSRPPS